jgi:hypothetical protein
LDEALGHITEFMATRNTRHGSEGPALDALEQGIESVETFVDVADNYEDMFDVNGIVTAFNNEFTSLMRGAMSLHDFTSRWKELSGNFSESTVDKIEALKEFDIRRKNAPATKRGVLPDPIPKPTIKRGVLPDPIPRPLISREVQIPRVEQSKLDPGGGGHVHPGIPGFTINDPYGNPLVTPGGGPVPGYVHENGPGVPGWGPGPYDKEGLFPDMGSGSEDSGLPPGASGVANGSPGPGDGWTYVGDRWPRENDPFSKADECQAVRETVFVDIGGNDSNVIELDCVGPLDIKESDGSSSLRAAREQNEEETKKKADGLDSGGGWWERQFTPDQTSDIHKAKMDQTLEDILTGRLTEEDRTDQPWESRRVNKEGGITPGKDANVDTDDTGRTRRYGVHLVGMGFSAEIPEAIRYWIDRGAPIDPIE